MNDSSHKLAGEKFTELVKLIARLRAPGGCPWDREQTHESLKPMLLEEAYEVIEAIDEATMTSSSASLAICSCRSSFIPTSPPKETASRLPMSSSASHQ